MSLISPVFAALTILPGDTYINSIYYENYDFIDNRGYFENNSLLLNRDYALFDNSGIAVNNFPMLFMRESSLINSGNFDNYSQLGFESFSTLENYGNFTNYSQLDLLDYVTVLNAGIFNNHGIIQNYGSNIETSIINSNVLNNFGSLDSDITNSGTINNDGLISTYSLVNQASGTINNSLSGIINMNQNITNVGVFNHSGEIRTEYGLTKQLNNSGQFNNDGVFNINSAFQLNNSGEFYNNTGLSLFIEGSEITNTGVFENNSFVSVWGDLVNGATGIFNNIAGWMVEVRGTLENRGEFNNQSNMSFYESYDPVTGMAGPALLNNSGVFNHNGNIDAVNYEGFILNNSGEFNNNGSFNAYDGFSINNSGVFNNNTNLNLNAFNRNNATVVNSGVFHNNGVLERVDTLTNSGTFENNGGVSVWVRLVNGASGVFNNMYSWMLEINGELENRGQFNNQSNITFNERFDPITGQFGPALLVNSGVFNHNGSIDAVNYEGLVLNNSGEFNNNGSFNFYSPMSINNSGVFNNNISLNLNAWSPLDESLINSGTFNNNAMLDRVASLTNTGVFENNGSVSVWGRLTNGATGVFNNNYGWMLDINGELESRGQFNNQSNITLHENYDPVTGMAGPALLNNSGVFNHNGNIDALSYEGLVLSNSGEFNNNGSFNAYEGFSIVNSGVFNNNSNLYLNGWNPQRDIIINTGAFNNNADIDGVISLQNTGVFENNRTVSVWSHLMNGASGVFNNNFGGMLQVGGALENRGEINNQSNLILHGSYDPATGMIGPVLLNNNGIFNNIGHIEVMSGEGIALNNSGEFNNNGSINSYNGISINNSGLFNSNTNLYFDGWNAGSDSINNSGTFNNNADLNAVEYLSNTGVFENNGTVSVWSSLFNGVTGVFNNINGWIVEVNGVLDNRGEFNNQRNIYLHDGFDPVTGLVLPAGLNNSGIFNNEGAINADGLVLNNSGVFNHIGYASELSASRLIINNTGEFNNGDNTYWYSGNIMRFENDSRLNNYGTFNNYNDLEGGFYSTSEINNAGVLNNMAGISNFSNIRNTGAIQNHGWIVVGSDGDTLINNITGVINNNRDGFIRNEGSIINNGVINNNQFAFMDLNYGSSLDNAGAINNEGDIVGGGNINNSGVINNNSYIDLTGDISNSGLLNNNGILRANFITSDGVINGNGEISVGNGLVITEAGTLAPGNSTGTLNIFGDVALDGTLEMEFDWFGIGGMHDVVNVYGNLELGADSVLDISFLGGNYFSLGQSFDLMFANDIIGDFGSFYYDALFDNGLALQWEIFSDFGQDILRVSVVSAVPIPAAAWLFISGMIGLFGVAKRKKRTLH